MKSSMNRYDKRTWKVQCIDMIREHDKLNL